MTIVKWLGAGIGWAFGGPIGAMLGFILGSGLTEKIEFNKKEIPYKQRRKPNTSRVKQQKKQTQSGDFELSFLILSAVVIKADGKVDQRELDYVRVYFIRVYGKSRAGKAFKLFNGVLKRQVPTTTICAQIRQNMDHDSRLQLIHFLFGIAKSDGIVNEKEIEEIRKIAGYLYVNQRDFISIKAMFYNSSESAYQILEISSQASNDLIKKAYRKMVKKYHPDKLQHLGEEHVKVAEEKFRKVQKAYESIQRQRGL